MANPYHANDAHRDARRDAHRDAQRNGYQGSLSHKTISRPEYGGKGYVNPVHLVKNRDAGQYRNPAEGRPLQSVQVVIPSPQRGISTMSPETATPVSHSASTSAVPPLDYQLLLLSLAEDYFAAARGAGSALALLQRQPDILEYQKLVATGLTCLEASLKYWRLPPLLEASIQLRYATILHEETENLDDAEEALSKGIILSGRLQDFYLKYNMQHLLARVLYRGNARAGLKYLDKLIEDVEAYQHVPWAYAFRFLRVSLSLECSTHQEVISALNHLHSIFATSQKHSDAAVGAIASTLEALIHLQASDSAESIEQAQRAIALARRSQLDPAVGDAPKLVALTHFVDLCCTLRRFEPSQATAKMQAMQATLEALREGSSLDDDNSFSIPIDHTAGMEPRSKNGVIRSSSDGTQLLNFDWIPTQDIYSLGFLLSGICVAHKNTSDGQKSESMLHEGIRLQQKLVEEVVAAPQPICVAVSRHSSRLRLKASMHLHLAFVLSTRTAWLLADEQLRQVKALILVLGLHALDDLSLSAQYLEGVIQQAAGNLESSLTTFQSPSLAITQINRSTASQLRIELASLSALNTLLIIRSNPHNFETISSMLEYLEPICANHANKAILTAYNFVIATVSAPESIVRTKQSLQYALQAAKFCGNKQLLCMTLSFLSWKFFRGVLGDQAEKSARTSHQSAKMAMDRLWMSVSAGILGEALGIQGRGKEAEAVKQEGRNIAAGLPAAVQRLETTTSRAQA